jgi:parallel beta-helix repeat protein
MKNKNGPMRISKALFLIIPLIWSLLSHYSIIEEEFSKESKVQNENDYGSIDSLLSLLIQTEYEVHDPISINGNADFIAQAIVENWLGDGTLSDPYVIDGYNITSNEGLPYGFSKEAINIKNTDLHFRISNSLIREYRTGIYLTNVSNGMVSDNFVIDNYYVWSLMVWGGNGITLSSSENNTLTNNTIIFTERGRSFGGDLGIDIRNSGNNIITENNLENATFSFDANYIQENLTNNFVNGKPLVFWQNINGGTIPSGAGQIILVNSTAVEVIGQQVSGIQGINCSDLLIFNNNVSNSNGIILSFSANSTLSNNMVSNDIGHGIKLEYSGQSILTNNTVTNNSVNTGIILSFSGNSTLSNNMVSNNGYFPGLSNGIRLSFSGNSTLSNNMVSNNLGHGIRLDDSGQSIVTNNTITNNVDFGIYLQSSYNSAILNNSISNDDNPAGIFLGSSGNTKLLDNYLFNTELMIGEGIIQDYLQEKVTNNFVNGKPLVFWQNINGGTIPSGTGQIILVNSTAVEVTGQQVSSIQGIYSSDLFISNNTISNRIRLEFSERNTLSKNTIINTGGYGGERSGGIQLYSSTNNNISVNVVTNSFNSGIRMELSAGNTISANEVTGSGRWGIIISTSDNNTFANNYFAHNSYSGLRMEPQCSLNTVTGNIFIGNNLGEWSQVGDYGFRNSFAFNFFDDWTDPDVDGDGIVDQPYQIEGYANNQDPFPLVSSVKGHYLKGLELLYPNGGENLNNSVTVYWTAAIDSLGFVEYHTISYSIYFSSNNGVTWELLASDLFSLSYSWNTAEFSSGKNYLLKIVAKCYAGLMTEDISDDTFRILNFPLNSQTSTHSTDFLPIYGLLASFSVLGLLTIRKYRRKRKE